jgi:sulfite exporter TauE/SafE
MEVFVVAFTLGLFGSFHCIGMCGPIALALPIGSYTTIKKVIAILLYNIGRVTTYSIIGLIVGFIGQSISLVGFQQYLSITLGSVLIIGVLLNYFLPNKHKHSFSDTKALKFVKSQLAILFKQKSISSIYLIGVLNGFLPCGFVYIAVAGAIATGNYLESSKFMAAFGLGTIPVMLVTNFAGMFINIKLRNYIKKLVPTFVLFMGLLLVLRGMNLGIPFVSPKADIEKEVVAPCCK